MKTNLKFSELIDWWLSELDVNPASRATYMYGFRYFHIWCVNNKVKIRETKTADVIAYKRYLVETKSARTADLRLAIIRRFFGWLKLNKIYSNPTEGVKTPRRPASFNRKPLTIAQAKQLLEYLPNEKPIHKRDRAIVNLMLRSGLRIGEISSMNIGDIFQTPEGNYFARIKGKGRLYKDQTTPVLPKAWNEIQNYLSTRENPRPNDPLFISYSRRNAGKRVGSVTTGFNIKSRMKAAGIIDSNISAHSLRHTCADLMLRHGAPLFDVMTILRHSSPGITTGYLKQIEREKSINNPSSKIIDEVI